MLAKKKQKRHSKEYSLDDYDSSSSYNTDYDCGRHDYEDTVYKYIKKKKLTEEKDIHRPSDDWTIKSIIFDSEIQTQLDTGARCNVISQNVSNE